MQRVTYKCGHTAVLEWYEIPNAPLPDNGYQATQSEIADAISYTREHVLCPACRRAARPNGTMPDREEDFSQE
ncbi:MAG TPA: hypothetical protein VGM05_22035 [Planctomycetaceae bacterium]|jgi:hypothetical protein